MNELTKAAMMNEPTKAAMRLAIMLRAKTFDTRDRIRDIAQALDDAGVRDAVSALAHAWSALGGNIESQACRAALRRLEGEG